MPNTTKHKPLDDIVINPKLPAKCSVIWMHGLGADGYDFVNIIPELNLQESLAVRFVFPHAPVRPVTRMGGMPLRAWFDIGAGLGSDFSPDAAVGVLQDELGVRASQILIENLIANELAAGIPSRRIILAGFSQGGAMALQCGLRYPEPLGGVLSLSGFLPLAGSVAAEKSIVNQNIPIFMAHGMGDSIVPIEVAENDCRYLNQLGFNARLLAYDMEHAVCAEEIQDIAAWLQERFAAAYNAYNLV
jgi:phospholipase/carboxylesterase